MTNIPCGKMRKHEYPGKRSDSSRDFGNITAEPAVFTEHPLLRKKIRGI
jgi:hypothetical protein